MTKKFGLYAVGEGLAPPLHHSTVSAPLALPLGELSAKLTERALSDLASLGQLPPKGGAKIRSILAIARIRFHFIRQAQNIVYTGFIILSQTNQNFRRNHSLSIFIIGICALWDTNFLPQFSLGQIFIFT